MRKSEATRDWENNKVLGRNIEPPRANFIPYADRESAIQNNRGASPYFQWLNGDWEFKHVPSP